MKSWSESLGFAIELVRKFSNVKEELRTRKKNPESFRNDQILSKFVVISPKNSDNKLL